MAVSFKHVFASPKGDGSDPTLIQPSHWNAEHAITLATNMLLGRASAGTGNAEEVPCTAFGRSVIAAADVAAFKVALALGALSALDDVEWAQIDAATKATAAEFIANTASKLLPVTSVWSAAVPVATTATGTVTMDLSTGINRKYTIIGNVTLAVTNAKPGQSGVIEWQQDTTLRSLTLSAGQFCYAGTTPPNFIQTANAKFLTPFYVDAAGKTFISVTEALSFP